MADKFFKIESMKFPNDKDEIASWEKLYAGANEFESIKKYILEDNLYYGLGEVIETNHEIIHIGDDEIKSAHVARDENGEIIAFILSQTFRITTKTPNLFLQYLVVNPKFQHQGYGLQILKEFLLNSKAYTGTQAKEFFAYIDKSNFNSQGTFLKSGFTLKLMGTTPYYRATGSLPELLRAIEPQRNFE